MVATAETILESKLSGKRRSTSISSPNSAVNFTDHGSRITDQKFGCSDDFLIDPCLLVFERSARNRNYDASLGRWINQDPLQYINGANTYQFVESNPAGDTDRLGLFPSSAGGPSHMGPGDQNVYGNTGPILVSQSKTTTALGPNSEEVTVTKNYRQNIGDYPTNGANPLDWGNAAAQWLAE